MSDRNRVKKGICQTESIDFCQTVSYNGLCKVQFNVRHMIEVTAREFQREFKKYKDGYDEYRVVGKDGLIGIWKPAEFVKAEEQAKRIEKVNRELDELSAKQEGEKSFGIPGVQRGCNGIGSYEEEREKCEICSGVEDLYRFWEEGEERQVCKVCLFKKLGKMASSVIRNATKI